MIIIMKIRPVRARKQAQIVSVEVQQGARPGAFILQGQDGLDII